MTIAGHSPDRPRLVSGVRHSEPQHTSRTATVRVRRYRHVAGLAPVVPRGPDSVCQAGRASVTICEARGRHSTGVCPRASAVCRLLQPGG